jgi:hypothetical protein
MAEHTGRPGAGDRQGRITHEVGIDIARPRRRGSADIAAPEGSILHELLKEKR